MRPGHDRSNRSARGCCPPPSNFFTCQTANASPPADYSRAGAACPKFLSPTRGSGAPRRRGVLARHPWRAMTRHAGRLRGARVPLRSGTRASRRSTVVIFGPPGPRFRLRHSPPERVQRCSSRPGPSVRRAVPVPPGASGYEPQPRNATPCSICRTSPEDAPR